MDHSLYNDRDDIQALIVTGYGDLEFSRYLFLHINESTQAKKWLEKIIDSVTHAKWDAPDGTVEKPKWALNIAFTWMGFQVLGLKKGLKTPFSQEFEEGISTKERARCLGDTGASDPCKWELGGPLTKQEKPIHAVLMIQAKSAMELESHCQQQIGLFESLAGKVVASEGGTTLFEDKEHFGFRDSISQPEIEGSPKPAPPDQACLKPGEFVLGYENEYGIFPATPTVGVAEDSHNNLQPPPHQPRDTEEEHRDFGRNGSYLVFRKLEQDVLGFRRFLAQNARNEEEMLLLGAKLMGRWQSGAPIVLAPDRDSLKDEAFDRDRQPENNFYFMEHDPDGYRCPVSSHVRRTNPRDSLGSDVNESIRLVNRHRIIRRSVPYGPALPPGDESDGQARGLLFFCINADIRRQFEFIQQTWANNPKFNGLYDDRDAIIGDNRDLSLPNSQGTYCATIPNNPLRQRCSDVSRFVTVKGGAYFFLPSLSALRFLAGVKNNNKSDESAATDSAGRGGVPEPQDLEIGQEYPPPGEATVIGKIMQIARVKYEQDTECVTLAPRDEHPKSHGCVKAEFIVHDHLPKDLQYGVFQTPRTYPAWIRFSSSRPDSPSDKVKDAHGMAVKLMGVEGESVPEDKNLMTQDFVMANHNVFFIRSASDYLLFVTAFARGGLKAIILSFVLGLKPFEMRFLSPFKWRLHEFKNMIVATQKTVTNPLQIRYWSQCPSKLGPHAIKFSAKPCSSEVDRMPASPGDNFLQEAVTRQLTMGPVSFDFMVQLQTDAVKMPVEDSTIVWDEKLSPFQKVATIRIPVQDPDSPAQLDFSENISFTPWHSLPDHRPLGNTNRIRRTVYEMISKLRHKKNDVPRVEPTGTEAF